MRHAILQLLAFSLLVLAGCAQTEEQRFGYQTGELMVRADQITDFDQDFRNPYTAAVIAHRRAYNQAVLRGDTNAMREELNNLDRAEKLWGGQ